MPISLNDSFRKSALTASLFVLLLLWAGCGETYRPVANPITKPGGDPQSTHYAVVLNSNGGLPAAQNGSCSNPSLPTCAIPSATQIDVSGDTNIGNHPVGQNPVHAVIGVGFGRAYIVNQGDNTLSTYSPLGGVGATVTTIGLLRPSPLDPAGNAGASYVATSTTLAFVVESALNRVLVIDGFQLQVRSYVPVGVNPVTVACTFDGRKAYVVNQGSNTVSVISTKDDTNQKNIPVGSSPGPVAISSDGNYVFVANQGDGTVSVIDTNTDSEVLPNGARLNVGTNPSQLLWDDSLKRVYVVNQGSASVSIIDAHVFPQSVLTTVTTSPSPVAVAPLADSSKFYVLFLGNPGTVEVYDAQGFYKRGTITVDNNTLATATPTVNQVLLAASPDSTRVYAVNYNGANLTNPLIKGSTSIISTLTDSVVLSMDSPSPNPAFVTSQ